MNLDVVDTQSIEQLIAISILRNRFKEIVIWS